MYSQFRRGEVRDILIAWIIVSVAISFGYVLRGNIEFLIAALVAAATGFVLHEMSHKFVAIRHHYVAHFRLWTLGILLLLFFGVLAGYSGTGFLIGAPGAVYIEAAAAAGSYGFGYYSSDYKATDPEKENMLISAAGPATNLAFAAFFFFLFYITVGTNLHLLYLISSLGFSLNLGLGSFNMIPFPPLDGYKVFRRSVPLGLAIALPLWIPTIAIFFLNL